jgi:hypothetical protein
MANLWWQRLDEVFVAWRFSLFIGRLKNRVAFICSARYVCSQREVFAVDLPFLQNLYFYFLPLLRDIWALEDANWTDGKLSQSRYISQFHFSLQSNSLPLLAMFVFYISD